MVYCLLGYGSAVEDCYRSPFDYHNSRGGGAGIENIQSRVFRVIGHQKQNLYVVRISTRLL